MSKTHSVRVEFDLPGDDARLLVSKTLERLDAKEVNKRLWEHDHTLWSSSADDIANRLDWLHTPVTFAGQIGELERFAQEVRADGIRQAVLLGMGGSSLAPEVFSRAFGTQPGGIPLRIIGTTHPDAILALIDRLDPAATLFLVATKSGTTIETRSLFQTCYNLVRRVLPFSECGKRFVAITDPGSPLAALAEQFSFRRVFLSNPNLGGRYSAISHFGLVPAAILGVDLEQLLDRAQAMTGACAAARTADESPGAQLGSVLGAFASAGRNKLTVLPSIELPGLDDWLEQLIAESVGKSGKGIVPVVGEPELELSLYGSDRLFVDIEVGESDVLHRVRCRELTDAGHPLIRIHAKDLLDLGGLFVLWEVATAVVGHILQVHPFNQPDVEAAKHRAREAVAAFREHGEVPRLVQDPADLEAAAAQLRKLLESTPPDGYVAIQAYLPSPPDTETSALLMEMRAAISRKTRCATTVGYGPRFLHSTGQLHKGGPDSGRFVQLLSAPKKDLPIPDEPGSEKASLTFATLLAAQAVGDRQALEDAGRSVVSIGLGSKPLDDLRKIVACL